MNEYTWRLKSQELIIDSKGRMFEVIGTNFEGEFEKQFFETEEIKTLPKTTKIIYSEDIDNILDFYPECLM